ncbi:hypothetical protein C9374_009440 [Naegleria lovaniensis]|uniref:Uncharacterized protein n=1 Tax=Naegleria lovaniensis TaxID=51637 RepID=A0AA88H196_NAELO|nr:uncharacterized protein C9374_009440 [Naegleria lovaniensis]KAG2392863.1 hypothetical protein C9374_009440 [Naegleria lovaniensis]
MSKKRVKLSEQEDVVTQQQREENVEDLEDENNHEELDQENYEDHMEESIPEDHDTFVPIHLNPIELLQEMNDDDGEDNNEQQEQQTIIADQDEELHSAGTENSKKRKRKKKKPSQKSNQSNQQANINEEHDEQHYQKAFYIVDEQTVKKIGWQPPEKEWLKSFFSHDLKKTSDNAQVTPQESSDPMQHDEEENLDDELDNEAQRYLLNVRYEAQNYCAKTVVATNIDSKQFEKNRTSIRDLDSSLYGALHLFDAFMGTSDTNQSPILITKQWEHQFLTNFTKTREHVQLELDKKLRSKGSSSSTSQKSNEFSKCPRLNGNYDEWKTYCLGEENVYVLWERMINKQAQHNNPETIKKKKKNRRGRKRGGTQANKVTTEATVTTITSETMSDSGEGEEVDEKHDQEQAAVDLSTSDMTTEQQLESTRAMPTTTTTAEKHTQQGDSATPPQCSQSSNQGHRPTQNLLLSYLDYVTTHALFNKMIHWTVSNFHNNSLLRRVPTKASSLFTPSDEHEDETHEDHEETPTHETGVASEQQKQQWITDYLLVQSKESNNVLRCDWLYHLLLAIDKPPNDTIGANMNQLLVWILENFSHFTPQEKEEFTKIVLIVIKYFGQGNPNIITYSDDNVNGSKKSLTV